jgi:two-component system nitrogen regulation response regulator NtrX
MSRILIVEDDRRIRANLLYQLQEAGHETEAAGSAEDALVRLGAVRLGATPLKTPSATGAPGAESTNGHGAAEDVEDATGAAPAERPDLLLLDVRLPGLSGVELVRSLARDGRLPPTVIVSGEASISETVEALQLGVHDFIEKPFSRERLLRSVDNALEHAALRREVESLETELRGGSRLLGDSPAMEELSEKIAQAAPTDARVLLVGESGTGKELVADAIHRKSRRHGKPFVKINCASIPESLVEGELFGHARGAFTDARSDRPGLFEEADGGTLFLDEIGDMPLALQARLLRVLEDGRVRRLGEVRDRQVDVRVLTATHHDLRSAVADGEFRQDLYFRLAHLEIRVPPLRDRPEDVRPLFLHFVDHFRRRHRTGRRRVEDDVFAALERHPWPGNVRELKAVAERLVVFGGDPITAAKVAAALPPPGGAQGGDETSPVLAPLPAEPRMPLRDFRGRCEREYIERVLESTGWNVSAAARVLEIQRTYLHQKMAALGISRPE